MNPSDTASAFASLLFLLVGVVVSIGVVVIIFLVIRSLVLWYWRVNEALDGLHALHEQLVLINRNLESIEGGLARWSAHSSQSQMRPPQG